MKRRTAAVVIGTVCVVCNLVADIWGPTSIHEGWDWIGLIGIISWGLFAYTKDKPEDE